MSMGKELAQATVRDLMDELRRRGMAAALVVSYTRGDHYHEEVHTNGPVGRDPVTPDSPEDGRSLSRGIYVELGQVGDADETRLGALSRAVDSFTRMCDGLHRA
jgi:hypothetical protein